MTVTLRTSILVFLSILILNGAPFSIKAHGNNLETPEPLTGFLETFDDTPTLEMPEGWSAHVTASNTTASIGVSTIGNPYSGDQHLRFTNSNDSSPIMIASTPLTTNFNSNWLTFWSTMATAAQISEIAVGYTTNPEDPDAFVAIDTVQVAGNIYTQHFVNFEGINDQQNYHIAFQYLPETTFRTLYIDDVHWTQKPATPLLEVTPDDVDFGRVDLNASLSIPLVVKNIGTGTLTINQGDITITGVNADRFTLVGDLQYPISLETNESDTLEVEFSPVLEGAKIAQLEIVNNTPDSPVIIPLEGEGLGTLSNFFENFDSVEAPAFPGGWSGIHIGSAGSVETISSLLPHSGPNHVRMMNGNDSEALLILVGPKVKDFQTNWVRFFSRMTGSTHNESVVIGYMPTRDAHEEFVAADTVLVQGNVHSQYTALFGDILEDADEKHIAFKFIPSSTSRVMLIDDIMWDVAPTDPVMVLSPDTLLFDRQVFNTSSDPMEITITNDGAVPFTVSPSDITITGTDASDFVLHNIEDDVTLEMMESVEFSVSFFPTETGDKVASVDVMGMEIFLSGESADPTITDFPVVEDFDQVTVPDLPFGWTSIVNNPTHSTALVATTTATGPHSSPNHLRIFSNDNTEAFVAAITPPIEGLASKRIRFMLRCNLSSNVPPLMIGTMSNPADESTFQAIHIIDEGVSNSYEEFILPMNETVGENQYLVFRQGPTPSASRSLFIDDLLIEEIPTEPLLIVEPDAWTFAPGQIGFASRGKEFSLANEGAGILVIEPGDITISGPDADYFILENLSETANLAQFEATSIKVAFSPVEIEDYQATLNILDMEIPLSGSSFDATITEIPHLEDFDSITTPELPLGWTSIVDNPELSVATVETTHLASPQSAPHHVRLNSNNNEGSVVMLISPPVTDLHTKRVRFHSKTNLSTSVPNLIIGTMSAPGNENTFNPIDTIHAEQYTTSYGDLFTVNFNPSIGDDVHIAFKFDATSSFGRFIYLDDILIEEIPDEPVLLVTPGSIEFGLVQTGEITDIQNISITNDGGGILTLDAGDISLAGDDASEFVLANLTEEVNLAPGESAVVSVAFAPITVGNKSAFLEINDNQVTTITGEGIDATIYDFPWTETFTGISNGELPFGWSTDRTNWGVINSSHAGGSTPELRFHFSPGFTGTGYVSTPRIDTEGYTELMLTFKHQVNNYSSPGSYTLKVVTIVDGIEHPVYQLVDPDNVAAEELTFILNSEDHGIGDSELHLAWIFDGVANDINQWYVDDITLQEAPERYTVTFNVEDEQGAAISDAVITFGNVTNNAGDYVFTEVFAGTYDYTITADHFDTFIAENIEVSQDMIIDAEMTASTYTVTFTVEDNSGNAIDDAVITFDDVTNASGDYVFEGVYVGSYAYSVEADGYISVVNPDYQVDGNSTVEITMNPVTYTVTFVVKDQDDEAITNALITFDGETNAAGDYVFTDVLAGSYDYQVTADEFIAVIVEDLVVSEDMTVNVVMNPVTYTITFVIEDEDSNAITDAVVTFGDITNAAGDYIFTVPAGTYDFTIEADGYHTVSAPGYTVTQDATISETLILVTYSVTFIVKDEDGDDITDAVITFDGLTNDAGVYVFTGILPGIYDYSVVAQGYEPIAVSDMDVDNDMTIDITMTAIIPVYTLTFDIEDTEGEAITDAVIFLDDVEYPAGDYVFADLEAGTYSYKITREGFFDVEDSVVITDEDVSLSIVMTVDNVSVPDIEIAAINIYPNPASSIINVVSDEKITELRVIDMLGQVVYSAHVNDNRFEVNVSTFKTGVYFVQIVTNKGMVTNRFQVSR